LRGVAVLFFVCKKRGRKGKGIGKEFDMLPGIIEHGYKVEGWGSGRGGGKDIGRDEIRRRGRSAKVMKRAVLG
jgi:hypothetical protein